jgi:hypothetical protein
MHGVADHALNGAQERYRLGEALWRSGPLRHESDPLEPRRRSRLHWDKRSREIRKASACRSGYPTFHPTPTTKQDHFGCCSLTSDREALDPHA